MRRSFDDYRNGWGVLCPKDNNGAGLDHGRDEKIAAGDLETMVPEQNRTDEIGDMSDALQVFKDGVNEQRRLEKEAEEAARKADERDRLDRERTEKQMETEHERERAEIA